MQVTISLENFLPEYHLKYDRNDLFKFLENCSKQFKINVNGYLCTLFNEIKPNSEGWDYYCNNYYGGSIYIKEDGIILYNWHYKYNTDEDIYDFQSVLISAYFSMLINFLPIYYRKIDYNDRLFLELNFEGIEKSVFYPPNSSQGFKYFSDNCEIPIKRILNQKRLASRNDRVNIVSEIFQNILSRCFTYHRFKLHKAIKISMNNFNFKEL